MSTPEERAAKVIACKNVEELIELVAAARSKREALEREGKDTSLFSLVIGNPPYTVSYGGDSISSHSVYPTFFLAGNALGHYSSIISPARWFNSPKPQMKTARQALRARSISFSKLYYTNEKLFPTATIGGGVTWYLREAGSTEDTDFFDEFQWKKRTPLFDKDGTVTINEIGEIRELIWSQHKQDMPTNKMVVGWFNLQPLFAKYEGMGNGVLMRNSTNTRQAASDIKMRMTSGSWRYFKDGSLQEEDYVPEGKVAMVFSAFAGHNSTVNGRSFILIERESAKSTMAIILNTLQEAAFWYKYARSKFFTTLCIGRLGGHNAQAQTYQDVPLFSFTESDPIDWSKSIPEIDEQLIAHFGLEEHREYILSAAIPYARELGQEYLDRLEDGGVDTSGINDWY